jgi:hypothetical protein
MFRNVYAPKNARPWLPQDVFDDPLLPRRTTSTEEAERTAAVAMDFRRLRAERLEREAAERQAAANMATTARPKRRRARSD